jgi:hypothetical protein
MHDRRHTELPWFSDELQCFRTRSREIREVLPGLMSETRFKPTDVVAVASELAFLNVNRWQKESMQFELGGWI